VPDNLAESLFPFFREQLSQVIFCARVKRQDIWHIRQQMRQKLAFSVAMKYTGARKLL
jgi:hypothetical protein